MATVDFKLAAGTNVGLYRKNNEDNFIVCPDLASSQWLLPQSNDYVALGECGTLLVVADGMGGMNAGEVASAMAVDTIQQMFTPEAIAPIINDSKAIQQFMEQVVKTADKNILNHSQSDSSTQGMGTTVVMAWLLGTRVYICWCGDSRIYVYNKRRGLQQLSKDHSFVQELIDKGELLPEYAHDHPLSNVITRCLGNEENRAQPDTRVYELRNGDVIMLCSDGLSSMCTDDQIGDIIQQFRDNPQQCRDELISAALSRGGHDNVTVALATVRLDGTEEENEEDGTDDAATENSEQNSEVENEDASQLATTLRNEPVRQRHGCRNILLLLLLIVVVAAVCIYLFADHNMLNQYVQPFLTKIKSLTK